MIKAESIQASRANGVTIHTLVCEFPLTILNQLLTHRAFSRNSSSARAVPVQKAVDQLIASPAQPIWTAKGKGMQGDLITDPAKLAALDQMHKHYTATAMSQALSMDEMGVHKQNAGRYLTPFQNCRIVLTATDWANWDHLRIDADAQPEIQELAEAIKVARDNAEIVDLGFGEYHVPFIKRHRAINGEMEYYVETDEGFELVGVDQAIKVSMSACAQTSYRKLDTSMEKAELIIPKLFDGKKVHASPSEHQATPMLEDMVSAISEGKQVPLAQALEMLQDGVTAINKDGTLASGNFTNWIQQRQLLPNHDGGVEEHVADKPEASDDEINSALQGIIDALGKIQLEEIDSAMKSDNTKVEMSFEEFNALTSEEQSKKLDEMANEIIKEAPELEDLITNIRNIAD